MAIRRLRIAVAAFFVLYLVAVTWPVGSGFAGARPFVLGLPLSFFWPALWIVLGGVALAVLDWAEERAEDRAATRFDDRAGAPES